MMEIDYCKKQGDRGSSVSQEKENGDQHSISSTPYWEDSAHPDFVLFEKMIINSFSSPYCIIFIERKMPSKRLVRWKSQTFSHTRCMTLHFNIVILLFWVPVPSCLHRRARTWLFLLNMITFDRREGGRTSVSDDRWWLVMRWHFMAVHTCCLPQG